MSQDKFEVKYRGDPIDISNFLRKHPGGINTLDKYEGLDIDEKFKFYEHSEAAEYLLQDYKIKNQKIEDESHLESLIDWDAGILGQLHKLGDHYEEWVNSPVDRRIRFFESSFMESFTETPWYVIPIFWIPIVSIAISLEVINERYMNLTSLLLNVLMGIVLWTFLEYILHRFLFHMKIGKSNFAKMFHFIIHGIHHKTPFDDLRLVFPPAPAMLIAIIIFSIFHYIFMWLGEFFNSRIITCGSILGYVVYDLTHYYLHHGDPDSKYFYHLKRYHNYHHFINHDLGFGVSSIFWDKIFRSENELRDLKFRLRWSKPKKVENNSIESGCN